MKNSESISNNQENQTTNEWEQLLGDHAKNAIGNGAFQTVADFRKEKAAREDYDPERVAWEKAHPDFAKVDAINAERKTRENLPRTALDYMREDLEDLQYGPLESYDKQPEEWKITETDEEISTPKKSNHREIPQDSNPQDTPKLQKQELSSELKEPPFLSQSPEYQKKSTGEPAVTHHESFESAHLKWPEETLNQKLDRTFAKAEDVLDHAEDVLADEKRQRAEQLEADEIAEINRVIAEMAYSGDEKLVEIMRQKDYESDEDHKNRLVRMAKTEMKWRELKKSIEDARKHMEADNAALARTRTSLRKSREVASASRPDTAPAKPVFERITEPAPKETEPEPAPEAADSSSETTTSSDADPNPLKTFLFKTYSSESNPSAESTSDQVAEQSSTEQEAEQTAEKSPEQKILKRDLADRIRDVLNKREAENQPSSSDTGESDSQPEKKILRKDLKDVLRAKIAEKEAKPEFDPESLSRARSIFAEYQREMADYNKSEKLNQAKAAVAEHQRRVEHVDDKLNAERDKLIKERSPSTRKKISKIFGVFSQRLKDRKEKSRKKAEKRWQEENEPWLDD